MLGALYSIGMPSAERALVSEPRKAYGLRPGKQCPFGQVRQVCLKPGSSSTSSGLQEDAARALADDLRAQINDLQTRLREAETHLDHLAITRETASCGAYGRDGAKKVAV
ncbi:hypothetical protein [Streptomyces sp. NPDC001205]